MFLSPRPSVFWFHYKSKSIVVGLSLRCLRYIDVIESVCLRRNSNLSRESFQFLPNEDIRGNLVWVRSHHHHHVLVSSWTLGGQQILRMGFSVSSARPRSIMIGRTRSSTSDTSSGNIVASTTSTFYLSSASPSRALWRAIARRLRWSISSKKLWLSPSLPTPRVSGTTTIKVVKPKVDQNVFLIKWDICNMYFVFNLLARSRSTVKTV